MMPNMMKPLLLACLICLTLSACAKKKEVQNSAELAYSKAMKSLEKQNYIEAAEAFAKIDDEYPFSKWALKAQSMAVYAYYKEEEYDKLSQIVDDFVRLNPTDETVPYMLYMKGRSYYDQIPDINRAQDQTQQASYTFRELNARFPQSKYKADINKKLSFVDEHLAGAKMSIGRYNIKIKDYVGAINNFNEVTSRYRLSTQTSEAYFRLVEIYYKLGITSEAVGAFQHLKYYYPKSIWVKLATNIDPKLFR